MEKPILFSTEMVRAILRGQKTQTRRVIKPQPEVIIEGEVDFRGNQMEYDGVPFWKGKYLSSKQCPYGQPGDVLWVRETWNTSENVRPPINDLFIYCADVNKYGITKWHTKWKPSIHMPRNAARLFLKVKNIRAERLWDITEKDAIAEGMLSDEIREYLLDRVPDKWCRYTLIAAECQARKKPIATDFVGGFACIWDRINAKRGYGWDKNPWVWVIEFERV